MTIRLVDGTVLHSLCRMVTKIHFTTTLNDGGNGTYDSEYICVPNGCYEVTVGGGSYDYEISFTLGDILVDVPSGTYTDLAIGDPLACEVFGCTDSTALNFNCNLVTMVHVAS